MRGLRVLYAAAHTFGSTLGDAAIGSSHATKLFHTVEGGCVVVLHADGGEAIALLRAFGHVGDTHRCLGINAKMSELHAAMGAVPAARRFPTRWSGASPGRPA